MAFICGLISHVLEQAAHQLVGLVKAGIQVHRANHGLQRIGQDGRPLLSARARFALAQAQQLGQAQHHGQLVQGVLLDQIGAHARQIAFGQLAQLLVQQAGDRQIEHRVAQKLEAFVVVGEKLRCVSACGKQFRIGKLMLQALLQRLQSGAGTGAGTHLFGAPVVLQQQVGRTGHVDFPGVGKSDDRLVAFLGHFEVLAGDRIDVVNLSRPCRKWPCTSGTVLPADGLVGRLGDGLVLDQRGQHLGRHDTGDASTPPTNSRPMKEMPRCRCFIDVCPD